MAQNHTTQNYFTEQTSLSLHSLIFWTCCLIQCTVFFSYRYDFCYDNNMPSILVLIILEMTKEFINKGYKLKNKLPRMDVKLATNN